MSHSTDRLICIFYLMSVSGIRIRKNQWSLTLTLEEATIYDNDAIEATPIVLFSSKLGVLGIRISVNDPRRREINHDKDPNRHPISKF